MGLLLASFFTDAWATVSLGMLLCVIFGCLILVAIPGGLTIMIWLNHRQEQREVIKIRLSHSEIVVTRADGTTGRYPTSALTAVLVDREHWTEPVYRSTGVWEFRRLKLTFGDVAEQTRPGHAENDESFGAALAGLGVPIEHGFYNDTTDVA
ncbi:hypothetical protein FHX34_104669 [Actinoplanes teichomyceticus]|uniref:Uncharacterized protein n=1 Tax=Actinoplanes teichomyceticus TaxID=1867 RepID=A0A561VRW6_ACTTI|nr:hypothetical protein FHX34_104669 [Actinoplanes teichomyceticus]